MNFNSDCLLVVIFVGQHFVPAEQCLRKGDLVYFDQLPIFLGQNAVADTAWGKDRADIVERLSQTVTHLVYVVPLLSRFRCYHVVSPHLSLVEYPLEDEQRC